MNKVILIGNLTRDPELSQTPNGVSVCKFSIAVNRNYANANGERDADFINIVTWRGCAENCAKYLRKGKKVALCGQIQTRTYDDKNGNKHTITEVVAEDVEFIGGGKTSQETPQENAKTEKPVQDNDLPF